MLFTFEQTAEVYRKILNPHVQFLDATEWSIISVYLNKIIPPSYTRRTKAAATAYQNSIVQLGFSTEWLPDTNFEKAKFIRFILLKAINNKNNIITPLAEQAFKQLLLIELRNKTHSDIVDEITPLIKHWQIYFGDDINISTSLGKGTYGEVFKMAFPWTPESNNTVIKKPNKAPKSSDRTLKNSVLREAVKILKLPPSEFVIDCLGIYVGDSGLGFLMSHMDRGSLRDYINNNNILPSDQKYLSLRIGQGLQHMHNHNMIHADLNPSNVLMRTTPYGIIPVICDLGASEFLDSSTGIFKSKDFKTTYGYAAIELILRFMHMYELAQSGIVSTDIMEYTKASDIYSYAGVVYLLATRCDPTAYESQSQLPDDNLATIDDIHLNYDRYMNRNYCKMHRIGVDSALYSIITLCWDFVATNRPDINTIVNYLEQSVFSDVPSYPINIPSSILAPDTVKLPVEQAITVDSPGTLVGYGSAAPYFSLLEPAPVPAAETADLHQFLQPISSSLHYGSSPIMFPPLPAPYGQAPTY